MIPGLPEQLVRSYNGRVVQIDYGGETAMKLKNGKRGNKGRAVGGRKETLERRSGVIGSD